MFKIDYLTDKNGEPKAVVIPIYVWRQLFFEENMALDDLSERLEDYCLNQGMDEAKLTPLLDREAALQYLDK
ncbi:MAG: hypothetical protein F6K65_36305 [Moorea sp. SIO3C2]|nr:hypothetical protein [Moorena sp. SIO3C2]